MRIDHAIEYADALAELIPDERVLAATVTKHAEGLEPAAEVPDTTEDSEITIGSAIVGGALGLLTPPGSFTWPAELVNWLLFGRAAGGEPSSIAARIRRASSQSSHAKLLVVTEHWIYLFDQLDLIGFTYSDPTTRRAPRERLKFRCRIDRRLVHSADVRWYRLNPGRLVIHFVDDSWTAFSAIADMSRRRAQTIADVLNGAEPQER